jgi:Tfp pilus assembly protein PilF
MPKLTSKKSQDQASSELLFAAELERHGLLHEAEARLMNLLKTQPREWRALHKLAEMHLARADFAQALSFMAAAMKANPSSAEAKTNYGFILQKLDRHEEALSYCDRAIAVRPDHLSAHLNRGTSLHHLNRSAEALASFDRALALDPRNIKALYNRANILHELQRFDECIAAFSATIAYAPDYADAHWNEGLTRLLLGDFEQGWKKYEWRWNTESQRHLRRDFTQPLWLGAEPIAGKTILVHAEQGFGDTLQLVRYLPLLAAKGADVVLEVQPTLFPLLSPMEDVSRVMSRGEPLPHFDVHCPIMSLPLAFNTSLETIPSKLPYLDAKIRLEKWTGRLQPKGAMRIAFAWAGSATHKQDRLRSIPISKLQPLLEQTNSIQWISVQRDLREGDREHLAQRPHIQQVGYQLEDFADTAAVLSSADLVITVDTAVAHLAGALGRPVWILLQHSPDFRWLLDRDDSPWYPSARLFRQNQSGDWDDVISRATTALRQQTSMS